MRQLLTPREKEILDTLVQVDVGLASLRLKISKKTIYNTLYKLRKKQLMARHFINVMLGYRNREGKLEDLLTPKVKLKFTDEENFTFTKREEEEELEE